MRLYAFIFIFMRFQVFYMRFQMFYMRFQVFYIRFDVFWHTRNPCPLPGTFSKKRVPGKMTCTMSENANFP